MTTFKRSVLLRACCYPPKLDADTSAVCPLYVYELPRTTATESIFGKHARGWRGSRCWGELLQPAVEKVVAVWMSDDSRYSVAVGIGFNIYDVNISLSLWIMM
jgi:hypothetical protein